MIGAIATTLGNIKQGSEGERLDDKDMFAVIEAGTLAAGKTLSLLLGCNPYCESSRPQIIIISIHGGLHRAEFFIRSLPDLLEQY